MSVSSMQHGQNPKVDTHSRLRELSMNMKSFFGYSSVNSKGLDDLERSVKPMEDKVAKMRSKTMSKKSIPADVLLTEKVRASVWPNRDSDVLASLLDHNPRELDKTFGVLNDTLLHRAAFYGNKKAVRILLDRKAKIDAKDANGQTALHIACSQKQLGVVQMLVDEWADVNLSDIDGDAPIHLACKGGSMAILKVVMEKSLCKMGCEGNLGNSLLHYAAKHGHVEMMKYLIDNGNHPSLTNYIGETPLHLAAGVHINGVGTEPVELLLDQGADLNVRNLWGDTPAHYAAFSGRVEVLQFLCEEGVDVEKPSMKPSEDVIHKHGLSKEFCELMEMSLLQKVARSACVKKANYVIDRMMWARNIMIMNQSSHFMKKDRFRVYNHVELSKQELGFKRMAHELQENLCTPNSAFRLFLKYLPESVDYLFNKCLVSFCGSDQIQGKIFFDFFMFFPPDLHPSKAEVWESNNSGELKLMQTLIDTGKERFLTHPVFETFLKLKWYRTWQLYLIILLLFGSFVIGILGYSLSYYGNIGGTGWNIDNHYFWWWFLSVTSTYVGLAEGVKLMYGLRKCFFGYREGRRKKDYSLITYLVFRKCRELTVPILPMIMLYSDLCSETKRYLAAIAVILACHSFMLALSRIPKIGIYIFMLSKVFTTIISFFLSYFWHFLGYAIAFHILMPRDGAFSSLGDSIIKVLTMLMGEYDFTDNFVNDNTFWLTKALFVMFVIDMSVVLMNLVLGLAVNDVESILQDSNVRRMVHETLTVAYLEELQTNLAKFSLPLTICSNLRITNSDTCQFKEVIYLNLVDIAHHDGNELVIDRICTDGQKLFHPCPESVSQNIVSILKKRLSIGSQYLPDATSQLVISELKDQNVRLETRIDKLDGQLESLLSLVHDLHSQLPKIDKT